MAVCSLVSPGGHSLNEDFLGAMCSWEARVQAWKTGWAYSFIRQHVIWHLKNPFLFFFKDEVVLSMSIWKKAVVLHGPFMSLQSCEVTDTIL